ncbi:hypothetical protein Droror1_Dr00012705, partial [Drosera rotundifolia]
MSPHESRPIRSKQEERLRFLHVTLSKKTQPFPFLLVQQNFPARSLLPLFSFSFLLLLLSPPPPPPPPTPSPSPPPPLSLEDTRSVARVSIWGSISGVSGGSVISGF